MRVLPNNDELDFDHDSLKNNSYPKIINKYNPFRIKKNIKKYSITSIIIIIFEITFIFVTFFLSLQRAIKTIMKRKDVKNYIVKKNNVKDLKVCLCTPVKLENKYIKDFVQFYQKIGVDKIFLYDNNDKDGEKIEDIIPEYIKNGFVEISDWRGKQKQLMNMMDDCYQRNYKIYDWLIFYEVDEYIHLKNYTNIKNFLINEKFDTCPKIYLNWVFHTDNDQYHYEKKPVQERFPQKETIPENKNGRHNFVKTIIRGHLPNLKIDCVHRLVRDVPGCNGNGKEVQLRLFRMVEQDFEKYYIDHYFCKSVDEFIEKLNRGDAVWGHKKNFIVGTFANYFGYNKMTKKKIEYVEQKTGLDLSEFKKMLNNDKKS